MACAAWRKALCEPATYPEPTSTVEVRETHISLVFLTDHYAYKIKKPVDLRLFGFLDAGEASFLLRARARVESSPQF